MYRQLALWLCEELILTAVGLDDIADAEEYFHKTSNAKILQNSTNSHHIRSSCVWYCDDIVFNDWLNRTNGMHY